jgi:hypothetical protein
VLLVPLWGFGASAIPRGCYRQGERPGTGSRLREHSLRVCMCEIASKSLHRLNPRSGRVHRRAVGRPQRCRCVLRKDPHTAQRLPPKRRGFPSASGCRRSSQSTQRMQRARLSPVLEDSDPETPAAQGTRPQAMKRQEDSSSGAQLFEQALLLVETSKRRLVRQSLELPRHCLQASADHGGIFCHRQRLAAYVLAVQSGLRPGQSTGICDHTDPDAEPKAQSPPTRLRGISLSS